MDDINQKLKAYGDNVPFLLLPVRIETRFMQISDDDHQLWVRVYPDQWAVDTFEPELSETEIANAQEYWVNIWRAGGVQEQKRAAWRNLVASHGSGRAAWIVQSEENPDCYRHLNPEPSKDAENDLILVITTEGSVLEESQKAALQSYWRDVWLANGDTEKIHSALLSAFATYIPLELYQAEQLIEQYQPINLDEVPPAPLRRDDINVDVAFLELPSLSGITPKSATWTKPARLNILPERFVLLAYEADLYQPLEQLGNPLPPSLVVGPDPARVFQQQQSESEFPVSDEMKWMVDFETAVSVGMGFRLSLSREQWEKGFDKLMVIGIPRSSDAQENQRQLEDLIQHHHYSSAGFSLLPQGTPTNNTESSSAGFSYKDDADTSFDIYFGSKQFNETSNPLEKRDGQWLAKFLGIKSEVLQRVPHSNGTDQREAKAMNRALWPTTWGYALESMLHPLLSQEAVDNTREFFTEYVSGRGMLPTIRIGKQPYGILATTAFSQLAEEGGGWFGSERLSLDSEDLRQFLSQLSLLLYHPLGTKFSEIQADKVTNPYHNSNPQKHLVEVLSLDATSVSFFQVYLTSLQHLFAYFNYLAFDALKSLDLDPGQQSDLQLAIATYYLDQIKSWLEKWIEIIDDFGARLGIDREYLEEPELLEKLHRGSISLLEGPLIDDQPLSETAPIRAYTEDDKNYIQWLIDTANPYSISEERLETSETESFSTPLIDPLNIIEDGLEVPIRPVTPTVPLIGIPTEPIVPQPITPFPNVLKPLSSFEDLRLLHGFKGEVPPKALLFILLRHSLMLGYWDAALRLLETRSKKIELDPYTELTLDKIKEARREFNFIHIDRHPENPDPEKTKQVSESRWAYLYQTNPAITGNNNTLLVKYISQNLLSKSEARFLYQQIQALEVLKDVPTARLERVFAEHIDCCSYRLDAWKTGLVNYQLTVMRDELGGTGAPENMPGQGIYLGAYGWLEEVRPKKKPLSRHALSSKKLDQLFNNNEASPLMHDASNAGYIHAPSLNQAVTAAILRNGYLSNATPDNPDALAINLSSERVRLALAILEGIRNGQSLGAMLGYQLERGLHDRRGVEIDEFIFYLRKAFPLRADRLKATQTSEDVPIELIEARNVVDGVRLVNHIQKIGNATYPFDHPILTTKAAEPRQANAINAEVKRILDIHDAIADLAMAESVHQAVQGNYERAAANLDAFSKGGYPPEPEIVRTPRSGVTLTHRVSLHLNPSADHKRSPLPNIDLTPRAQAEPAINEWLAGVLPNPDQIACQVVYQSQITGEEAEQIVTQENLKLQPIDLLYIMAGEGEEAFTGLNEHILLYSIAELNLRPDTELIIHHLNRIPEKVTFFELLPLIRNLRSLILNSRALKPDDFLLQNESNIANISNLSVDTERFDFFTSYVVSLADHLDDLRQELQEEGKNNFEHIEQHIGTLVNYLHQADLIAVPQSNWSFLHTWKKQTFLDALQVVRGLVIRWESFLNRANELLDEYDELPQDDGLPDYKIELLQRIERLLSTNLTNLIPEDINAFKKTVLNRKREFTDKLEKFKTILSTSDPSLSNLLKTIQAELPVSDFDLQEPSLESVYQTIQAFRKELIDVTTSLIDVLNKKENDLNKEFQKYLSIADPAEKVKILESYVHILFGDDFKIISTFTAPSPQILNDAYHAQEDLLRYLTESHTPTIDFPLDDWLYGVARVREKIHQWEQTMLLSEALGATELSLEALQFPYEQGDCWLGLDFPKDKTPKNDRLLYTVHNFNPIPNQCGLLIDEWTENIPTPEETTGITFHYDQPNCEPPQTMLLVTPPKFRGHWQWDDLVQALNDTLEMAKARAVEPDQIQNTDYEQLLPATFLASALDQISIFSDLSENNQKLDIPIR